ncbi:hypothetical protein QP938_12370 [Porticoccaceae bacterium LTM1]|nr:hypothetical protein QP938_12370 [Porticoccaceae bacterium LTM1]
MKKLLTTTIAAAAFGLCANTMAEGINFDYLDIGYVDTEYDIKVDGLGSADMDTDGFALDFSKMIGSNMYFTANYADQSDDMTESRFGLGYVMARDDKAAAYVRAEYVKTDIFSNEEGYNAGFGYRSKTDGIFEYGIEIDYTDINVLSGVGFEPYAQFNFDNGMSLRGSYDYSDLDGSGFEMKTKSFQVSLRLNFNK